MRHRLFSALLPMVGLWVFCLNWSAVRLECQTMAHPSAQHPALGIENALDSSSPMLSPSGYTAWRAFLRKTLNIPETLPELQPQILRTFTPATGVCAQHIRYTTESGARVSAVLYLPENATGVLPGIVIVNDSGDSKSIWYDYYAGMLYARTGAAVLTYDSASVSPRSRKSLLKKLAQSSSPDLPKYSLQPGSRMVVDVLQAVSYLQQRQEVDSHRIAVLGYSGGSLTALLASAIDPRIFTVVLAGGGDFDGPGGYWESSHPGYQSQMYKALRLMGSPYASRSAMIYALHEEIGPTLVINGSKDSVMDIWHHDPAFFNQLKQQIIAIHGTTEEAFDVMFLPNTGRGPTFLSKDAVLWLNHQLHFANWKDDFIRKLPEIQVSQWRQSHPRPIYQRNENWQNANDLRVPDLDVPTLPREELDSYSGAMLEAQTK